MKNKLILHIGSPKTGTTAIQKFLYCNKELLRNENYLYPKIQDLMYPSINASPLQRYINNGVADTRCSGWKDFWNKVRKHLKYSNVILSWEDMFCYNTEEFFSAVKKEYDNIKIIVYIRRQDRYLESIWNQMVKYDPYITIDFNRFQIDFKYKYKLDSLSKIFGKQNIIVRVYENSQFRGKRKDAISDFFYSLNIDLDFDKCIIPNKNTNSAMFGNIIEIKRRMNYYLEFGNKTCGQLENIFLDYLKTISNSSNLKNADGMFTPEQRAEFLKKFEEENTYIAKEYLGREDGILFYDSEPIPAYKLEPENLYFEIKNMFEFIFEKFENLAKQNNNEKHLSYILEAKEFLYQGFSNIKKQQLLENDLIEMYFKLVSDCTALLTDSGRKKTKKIKAIMQICGDRNIFAFGTGEYAKYFVQKTDFKVVKFIDNDTKKTGQEFYNKKIIHPSYISDWRNCFIIITIKKPEVIESIEKQLQSYGLKKDIDYILATDFLNVFNKAYV